MTTEEPLRTGRALAGIVATVVLAACAARSGATLGGEAARRPVPATALDERAAFHLLSRTTFGPRPGDLDAVRRLGVAGYIERQLHPESIDDRGLDARLAGMATLGASPQAIVEQYFKPAEAERRRRQAELAAAGGAAAAAPGAKTPPPPEPEAFKRERQVLAELNAQKVLRAVYSERQLQEVLVDFWFNHFNVFVGKGADRHYVGDYESTVIRPRVFGRFRDLLGEVAESPAMLFYLDNWLSTDPGGPHPVLPPPRVGRPPAPRPSPKPGAARAGLNENYARELMELHTLGVDGGYTQRDVTEVARCFTGWTIAAPNDGGGFVFDPRRHDEGQKVVLGHAIPAGGGRSDGERVLDILAGHPATARFIATKLVRRLVADDPPRSLVDRAAARFRATGGDLREVVRTILTSDEFRSARWQAAKTKSPLEFVVSALRGTNARVDDPAAVVNELRSFGMVPYGCLPPTGYADRADAWTTAGSILARMSFAVSIVSNRVPGVFVDLPALEAAQGGTAGQPGLARLLIGPFESPATAAVVAHQSKAADVAALALGSPEFQHR